MDLILLLLVQVVQDLLVEDRQEDLHLLMYIKVLEVDMVAVAAALNLVDLVVLEVEQELRHQAVLLQEDWETLVLILPQKDKMVDLLDLVQVHSYILVLVVVQEKLGKMLFLNQE